MQQGKLPSAAPVLASCLDTPVLVLAWRRDRKCTQVWGGWDCQSSDLHHLQLHCCFLPPEGGKKPTKPKHKNICGEGVTGSTSASALSMFWSLWVTGVLTECLNFSWQAVVCFFVCLKWGKRTANISKVTKSWPLESKSVNLEINGLHQCGYKLQKPILVIQQWTVNSTVSSEHSCAFGNTQHATLLPAAPAMNRMWPALPGADSSRLPRSFQEVAKVQSVGTWSVFSFLFWLYSIYLSRNGP